MNDARQHKMTQNYWFGTATLGICISLIYIYNLLDKHYFGWGGSVYLDEEKPYLKLLILSGIILTIIMVTWLQRYPPAKLSIAVSIMFIVGGGTFWSLSPAKHSLFLNAVPGVAIDTNTNGRLGFAMPDRDTVPRTTHGR